MASAVGTGPTSTSASTSTAVHEHLIQSFLDLMLYENAVFYAERLFATHATLRSLHILAMTHIRSGDRAAALRLLQHHFPFNEFAATSNARIAEDDAVYITKLSYTYGVCLLKADRWQEAEVVLKYVQGGGGLAGSATELWMGEIFKRTNRESAALAKYGTALRLSPFNWTAATRFTENNHPTLHSHDDRKTARANYDVVGALYADEHAQQLVVDMNVPCAAAAAAGSNTTAEGGAGDHAMIGGSPASLAPPDVSPISSAATDTTGVGGGGGGVFTPAPMSGTRGGHAHAYHSGYPSGRAQPSPAGGVRSMPPPGPSRTGTTGTPTTSATPAAVREECAALLRVVRGIFAAVREGAAFNATEVARRVRDLPLAQRNTGYVMSLLAKAYYDEGRHPEAVQLFEKMRHLEPFRLDPNFMLYSSCLWQLQSCKKLAHLAQEMVQIDKLSVITQIVLGNTHSIVGEHESAIQLFSRGYAIDKYNAYASTLKGMEHLVLDELDDARLAFRTSLRIDPRHYAALHGLGSVAAKQEKWHDAVVYFRMASTINPNPPLLLAYAGALMEEGDAGSIHSALTAIDKVLRKCPGHELARLKMAEVYLRDGRLHDAKQVAAALHEVAPRESKVNLLLARIHRKMGDKRTALQYCTNALGLDPKDTPAVTYEMEKTREDALDSDDDEDSKF